MSEIHPFLSGKWRANILPPVVSSEWFINTQSFAYSPSKDIRSIFLGTFPTFQVVNLVRQNGNKEFFYGSRDNRFWPLLKIITGLQTTTVYEMFQLLQAVDFGITDILKEIKRNGQSSSDSDITPILFNNIIDLKSNFPSLTNVYTTSGGKGSITNGTSVSAAKWLRDAFVNAGYTVTGFNAQKFQKQVVVLLNGNLVWRINLKILWSPSDDTNIPLQGMVNRTPAFNAILTALPTQYNNLSIPMKARLVQWSYLLRLGGFPVIAELNPLLSANNVLLSTLFA